MEIATSTLTCMWNTSESTYGGEGEDSYVYIEWWRRKFGREEVIKEEWTSHTSGLSTLLLYLLYIVSHEHQIYTAESKLGYNEEAVH